RIMIRRPVNLFPPNQPAKLIPQMQLNCLRLFMNPKNSSIITLVTILGLLACQPNTEKACLAQPDPNWQDHDRARPLPTVVTPATASTQDRPGTPPSDATVLFDGKDLSAWASMDGSPTRWIVKDGYM